MKLKIISAHIENFKGIKEQDITFNHKTRILGANATGKTTIFDAVTWLLFNKNSLGAEKFEVRPLDPDGKQINYVDIVVSAILEKDGNQFELTKKQKQNWVKHRGQEEAEFGGNVNEYAINGYPKSEKEFKAFISDMMDEELFKLLSNPTYFTGLLWKKQREILMKLVQTESDEELATRLGGYDEILGELKVASTDDIQKKWQKSLKELKAKQTEIPVRIDELEKQIVDYDESALALHKAALEDKISTLEGTENQRANEALAIVKSKLDVITHKAEAEKSAKVNRLSMELIDIESAMRQKSLDINAAEYEIRTKTELMTSTQSERDALGKKYFDREKEEYTPKTQNMGSNSNVCPTCGTVLPPEKISALMGQNEALNKKAKKDFEDEKAADLKRLIDEGNSLKRKEETLKAEIKAASDRLEAAKIEKGSLTVQMSTLQTTIEKFKSEPIEYGSEYEQLKGEVAYLQQIVKDTTVDTATAEAEKKQAEEELAEVKAKISAAMNNANLEERIAELKESLKDVAQKIADCEKILYVLDNFVKAKMDGISDAINGCFELINVRLFKPLINGGIEECCDITINGVPFASLNNGARIVGGLDLIRTLGKIYDTEAFVFIDNAESVNDFNIPEMDAQLIELVVTDDKTMKVEV